MEMIQISVVAIITVMLTLTIKKDKPELAMVLSIAGGVIILIIITTKIAALIPAIQNIIDGLALPGEFFSPLIKIVGVAYVAEFAVGTCRDAGENALAAKVELAGKIIILVLALPVIIYLFEMLTGLIKEGI